VNWSSGTGCSPLVGVSWEPWALPVGLYLTDRLSLVAAASWKYHFLLIR
jgi:hypothetical protein